MRHMRLGTRYISQLALALTVPLTLGLEGSASAQDTSGGGASSGSSSSGGSGGGGSSGGAATASPGAGVTSSAPGASAPLYGGFVAPQTDPNIPIGGGNATESSSRPVTGDKEDGFDLAPKGGGGHSSFGNSSGPIFMGRGGSRAMRSGNGERVHTVRRGDTLWDICSSAFSNPYQWPRIWSYNPEIQNPHWIFPGDQVHLYPGAVVEQLVEDHGGIISRTRTMGAESVYLRDSGYIEAGDTEDLDWGSVAGSREDKLFLTDFDETYVRIGTKHEPQIGQELTVFRKVRQAGNGDVIQIQGTVRIDDWNPKERMARARIIESLDPIERGAEVGPVQRKFEVVSPVRNENELQAHIIASVHPHDFWGQNQVVFLDSGATSGLLPGNRMFIVRRGDAYHQSLPTGSGATRIAVEDPSPAATEKVPRFSDAHYPEEVVGEIRILAVRPTSATALVTSTRREVEINDVVVARKGY